MGMWENASTAAFAADRRTPGMAVLFQGRRATTSTCPRQDLGVGSTKPAAVNTATASDGSMRWSAHGHVAGPQRGRCRQVFARKPLRMAQRHVAQCAFSAAS